MVGAGVVRYSLNEKLEAHISGVELVYCLIAYGQGREGRRLQLDQISLNDSISLARFPHLFGENLVDEGLAWMRYAQVRSEPDL